MLQISQERPDPSPALTRREPEEVSGTHWVLGNEVEVVPSFPQKCPLISLRSVSAAEVGLAPYVQIFPYSQLLVLFPAMTISVITTIFLKNKSYSSP